MLKSSQKTILVSMVLLSILMFGALECYAEDYTVQDSSFTLYNGAERISDATASDGYCAKMVNNNQGWDIQYYYWDLSALKAGTLYDVYARVKVKHSVTNPTGNAFKLELYNLTYPGYVLPEKIIASSSTQDMVWEEYKIGTYKPNSAVDYISLYVAGTANSSQISDIYADYFIFKEHVDYIIQDSSFYKFYDAESVTDSMGADNSAARMPNGSGQYWSIQAKIDGTKIEAGKSYNIKALIKPEMSDWNTSSGDIFGYLVYDFTSDTYLVNPTIVSSETILKVEYYWPVFIGPISPDPSHDVRICFYRVDNAANYPAFKVDSVTLSQYPEDESLARSIKAYPYKISPLNQDELNDSAQITYTLPSTQTVYVKVHKQSDNSLVRTLVSGAVQSGENTVGWDGKDDNGQTASNDEYVVRVSNNTTDIFRTNVQVITGVTLTTPENTVKNDMTKGVWFDGGAIPYANTAAGAYLDSTFSDIQALGADTVFVSNQVLKSADVYSTTLEKAGLNNLKVIGLPDVYTAFNEALYNDEAAMYNHLNNLVDPYISNSDLYAYYLIDEPVYDLKLAENLKDMQRMLETIDPTRPVIITYSGVDRIELHSDTQKPQLINIDPYGVGEGKAIGDFTNIVKLPCFNYEQYIDFTSLQARKYISNEAPVWTILQIHNNAGWLRDPTPEEVRAMTYEAIGHGSKGFTYFMYQSFADWIGLIDANYNHAVDYSTVRTLFDEIETMKPTIKNMRRIANAATTTGGGNSAYASADVTTHEDTVTGDKYLVVVNHDCQNSANITITINRAKLGMDISAIRNVYDNANISFTADSTSYTISNLNFTAGNGRILKLVKDTSKTVYTGQDTLFMLLDGATKDNTDISASDSMTAKQTVTSTRGWNMQWYWDKTQFTPGETYDLYAVVKMKYATDMYRDESSNYKLYNPSGNAFSYGVYDFTTSSYPVADTIIAASGMENMFWHTIKIGSFVPSQTNTQCVYIMPWDNPDNVFEVYVDKFYFVKQ